MPATSLPELTLPHLLHLRLRSHGLTAPHFSTPAEVVGWFGAVQAQEYGSALWAVGHRLPGTPQAAVEAALANRSVVRAWAMRGTLQLFAAADVRWIVALLGARVAAGMAGSNRRLGITDTDFARSHNLMGSALTGRPPLSRPELFEALQRAGVSTEGLRGTHLLYRAGLSGLICQGPLQGRQLTYTLLDEWLPATTPLSREEALGTLAARYFRSHGPATLADYAWWAGITLTDANHGLQQIKANLEQALYAGQTYYWQAPPSPGSPPRPAYLLAAFDEYLLGYKDRSLSLARPYMARVVTSNGIFRPSIVVDGHIVGTWQRSIRRGTVEIEPLFFEPEAAPTAEVLAAATAPYAEFMCQPVVVKPG
jgi:hypothetical protein